MNKKFISIGILFLLLFSSSALAINTIEPKTININNNINRTEGNVTSLILGGPGYFINIYNGKDTDQIVDINVSITNFLYEDYYNYDLDVPAGQSIIFYQLGGLTAYLFARVSINVSVNDISISERNGFLVFGFIVFIPSSTETE